MIRALERDIFHKLDLHERSIIVMRVDVGDLPIEEIVHYMETVKKRFEPDIREDCPHWKGPLFLIPQRDGRSQNIEVVDPKDAETLRNFYWDEVERLTRYCT
jgi:hypothetical protein